MKILSLVILMSLAVASCGGRIPSEAKTSRMARSYFHKYGKKYKETVFRDKAVQEVDVKGVKELQKNVATSLVVLKMRDGSTMPIIMTILRKAPTGWRITGWEKFEE